MLNLSEGVVDVFKGDGYFEFEEAVSEHYSKKLPGVPPGMYGGRPQRQTDFPGSSSGDP
jgi:hypothetical protein